MNYCVYSIIYQILDNITCNTLFKTYKIYFSEIKNYSTNYNWFNQKSQSLTMHKHIFILVFFFFSLVRAARVSREPWKGLSLPKKPGGSTTSDCRLNTIWFVHCKIRGLIPLTNSETQYSQGRPREGIASPPPRRVSPIARGQPCSHQMA